MTKSYLQSSQIFFHDTKVGIIKFTQSQILLSSNNLEDGSKKFAAHRSSDRALLLVLTVAVIICSFAPSSAFAVGLLVSSPWTIGVGGSDTTAIGANLVQED